MQERVEIAESLVRDAAVGAAAGMHALRQVDEARVTAFARGYMNVLKECLDEFLQGYKEAKHAEVRSWLASNPAAFQQLAGRVQEAGGDLPYELLPPPPAEGGGGGATLRVGNSTVQLSEDALRSGGSLLQRGADGLLQRGARLLDAAGGEDRGGAAAAHSARLLRDAAASVRRVCTSGAAAAATPAGQEANRAVGDARSGLRQQGALQFAASTASGATKLPMAQRAHDEAAAVYAELRAALVGGQQEALAARAEMAAAAAAAASRQVSGQVQQKATWFQSWLSEGAETPRGGGLVGLRGTEALGEAPSNSTHKGSSGDPVEWALGALSTGNNSIRRAVRKRLAAEQAKGLPAPPTSPGGGSAAGR